MSRLRDNKAFIIGGLIALAFAALFLLYMLPEHIGEYYGSDWNVYYEDRNGTEYRIEEKIITSADVGGYIKVITTRQYLDVYLDGENIFSYHGDENGTPVRGIYPIKIDEDDYGKSIRLQMSSPYPRDNYMAGSRHSCEYYKAPAYNIDYYCGILCLIMGVSLAVIGIILVAGKLARLTIWMLSLAVLLFSGFVLSNTSISLATMSPHLMYYIQFPCFLLYPICMSIFLYISYSNRIKRTLFAFLMLPILFTGISVLLDIFGVASIKSHDFWYSYICAISIVILLIGSVVNRRKSGSFFWVALSTISVWLLWGITLLMRLYLFDIDVNLTREFIVVYTIICAIEVGHNIVLYTQQLIGMHYKNISLSEKNSHLSRYYANIEQHLNEVMLLKHEIRHHMVTINYLLKDGRMDELQEYLHNIGAAYEMDVSVRLSAHPIVNAIASYLKAECEKMDIRLELSCHVPEHLPLRDEDLSSLLLNLAENALESCARIERDKPRFIELIIRFEHQLFYLCLRNSMTSIAKQNGRFLSAKRNNNSFGYGMEVVQRIVDHNHGKLDTHAQDNIFLTEILLSMPSQVE
ncbi:GHKL domain-containing protein [Eubacteriales bacterium OttesenSCG-928-N14]|nr:GHKL domain-containing protein [Eubacteriales bacterium OttesenSCG-928-N14]